MVNKSIRLFAWAAAWLAAFTVSVNAQVRVGNPPDNSDQEHPVPLQTYAVIDLGGGDAQAAGTLVALNDDNQVTFGYGTAPQF